MDKSLDKFDQIPTKASRVQCGGNSEDQEEKFTVVFNKKKKKPAKPKLDVNKPEEDTDEFDIKRARHEVIRFGISGFDSKEKEDAKVTMAIKLGAKPPKRKYQNYKELLQEKKKAAAETDPGALGLLKLQRSHPPNHSFKPASRFGGKRKRQDEQNTISAYGKVDKTAMSSIKQPRQKK